MRLDDYLTNGWVVFDRDEVLLKWVEEVRDAALATRHNPAHADWLRCQGTWFVGVNALPNDATGAVGVSGPVSGMAVDFVRKELGFKGEWDRAQVSICYPGYPKQGEGESEASFRFRATRDAAHVDGLKPVGPDRRRKLGEFHAFLLGIPLTETGDGAAPLAVWDGSHEVIRSAFHAALKDRSPQEWPTIDLTEIYQSARRKVFETCERRLLPAQPGEAYLLHRLTVHGVSPWKEEASAPPEGRAILYFRPETDAASWFEAP